MNHIAIIPDGNRRWAKLRSFEGRFGHEEGVKRLEEISDAVFKKKIPYFTFWAGSVDNLIKRSTIEINFLTKLLKDQLTKQLASQKFVNEKIKFRLIGEWNEILRDPELKALADELERQTKNFAIYNYTILFGYDGRREMMAAIEKLRSKSVGSITVERVGDSLWTAGLPSVDLVVRTGGEPHWSSGFMMWLTADSQFYFTEKLWPDFMVENLEKALADFYSRGRRFGQ